MKNEKRHNNSKRTKQQKFGCYIAVLLVLTLPISQINLFGLTTDPPQAETSKSEKNDAKGKLLKLDNEIISSILEQGNTKTSSLKVQKTNTNKQNGIEGKTDEDNKDSKENDEKNEQNSQKTDNDNDSGQNSNNENSSTNNASKNSQKSSGNSSSAKKDDNKSDNSKTDERHKSGHWEQRLVKEAWTEEITTTQYRCMCGQIFDSPEAWQAHRPNP